MHLTPLVHFATKGLWDAESWPADPRWNINRTTIPWYRVSGPKPTQGERILLVCSCWLPILHAIDNISRLHSPEIRRWLELGCSFFAGWREQSLTASDIEVVKKPKLSMYRNAEKWFESKLRINKANRSGHASLLSSHGNVWSKAILSQEPKRGRNSPDPL
jgi:hypothetical protein